jgi:hypothetical protein
MTILALAMAVMAASPVFAAESAVTLGEGDAYLIAPDGTMYKSKISGEHHRAALAQGATEVSHGTVLYRHEGKTYSVGCSGPYIGAWKNGSPGTEKFC